MMAHPGIRTIILTLLVITMCGWAKAAGGADKPTDAGQKKKEGEVKFYGTADSAKKIVYVLDFSGSMLDTLDFLREEVNRSVNALTPEQSFNVVAFSEWVSAIYPELQKPTPEVKKDLALKMQNIRSSSGPDDMLEPYQKAFEAAFQMQPEVIYFLTDGRFDPRLVDLVTKNLNKDKKVRVNTLGFVINDSISEDQLKELAKKNGGEYKFVSEKDLGN